jgi:hypothetical protein
LEKSVREYEETLGERRTSRLPKLSGLNLHEVIKQEAVMMATNARVHVEKNLFFRFRKYYQGIKEISKLSF